MSSCSFEGLFFFNCLLCLTGGSIRSFGVARARYDFSARDRSELSLREGDTIKILSKKGHSGWWKGEVYGRVRRSSPQPHAENQKHNKQNRCCFEDVFVPNLLALLFSDRWDCSQPTTWRRITPTTADENPET